jgi:hypothetical protein
MEENIELKRPWIIKVFVIVFGIMFGISSLAYFSNPSKPWALIYHLIIMISVFGIWQGRYWARNLFLVLIIPFFLIIFFLFVGTLLSLSGIEEEYKGTGSLMLTSIFSLTLIFIPFFKSAKKWFDEVNSTFSKDNASGLSWQFQLIITISSIALGFIVISLSSHFEFLSFVKTWAQSTHPSYWNKVALFLLSINLSMSLSAFMVEFPFGLILGYVKRGYKFLLWRLISIGVFFPIYTSYFVFGNKTEHFTFFVAIAVTNLVAISLIFLLGMVAGEKIGRYIDTLRVPVEIK